MATNNKPEKSEKPKKRGPRKALAPLKKEQAETMKLVEAAGVNLLETVSKCEGIPIPHLRRYFSDLGSVFRARMIERRGDPVARKKSRLQERLAKIQAQLGELDKEKK